MICVRSEGEPVKNGFNFYSLFDKSSFGFILRYGQYISNSTLRSKVLRVRYSKISKKWFINQQVRSKV